MSVRVVIRDTTFDEPFVAFVQRRLRADTPPTLEKLLVLSHLKRNLELDLATARGRPAKCWPTWCGMWSAGAGRDRQDNRVPTHR